MLLSSSSSRTAVAAESNRRPGTVSEIEPLVQPADIHFSHDSERTEASDSDQSQLRSQNMTFSASTPEWQDDSSRPKLLLLKPDISLFRGPVFVAMQEWEGYVIEIRQREFVARLLDITAGAKREEEEATISFEEISSADREMMRLGSIFRWVIGYEHTVGGVKRRVSQIVFRQLPVLTQADWNEAWDWALETRRLLGLE